MSAIVQCSNCGAPGKPGLSTCAYCHAVFVVPGGAKPVLSASAAIADVPPGVVDALRNGNKIDAIRQYREATNSSLFEGKKFVEALEKKLGLV